MVQEDKALGARSRYILYGLAATTILFLILFIVFVSLFATKHENSSAFLVSGQTTTADKNAIQNELTGLLNNQFHVNTISVDNSGGQIATAVFSLRDSQSFTNVQAALKNSKTLLSPTVTDGSKSYQVCHQQAVVVTTPLATTVKANTTSNVPTLPATTTLPPISTKYCNGNLVKDIVFVVDLMNISPIAVKEDKAGSLAAIIDKLSNGMTLSPTGTRVYLLGIDVAGLVSHDSYVFLENNQDFITSWNKMIDVFKASKSTGMETLELTQAITIIQKLSFRSDTPVETVILAGHLLRSRPGTDLRTSGMFVDVICTSQGLMPVYTYVANKVIERNSLLEVAQNDDFKTELCIYYYNSQTSSSTNSMLALNKGASELDVSGVNGCQRLDMIFVFDISQSVAPNYLNGYKNWAKSFIKRYTIQGAYDNDNSNVGIISFSDDATTVMTLGTTTNDEFETKVDSVLYKGGLTNTLAAMKLALAQFNTAITNQHKGRLLIVMTDGEPTVGTLGDSVDTGKELTDAGVSIFFIGDRDYSQDTKNSLAAINQGHPDWIYGTPAEANQKMPQATLVIAPCPVSYCTMAYYVLEYSEAVLTNEYFQKSIDFVRTTSQSVAASRSDMGFTLIIYNTQATILNTKRSLADFQSELTKLSNGDYQEDKLKGHTNLEVGIQSIADDIKDQTWRQQYFQSVVIIAGQANTAVIDPLGGDENNKLTLLNSALQTIPVTSYILDESANDDQLGDDLWTQQNVLSQNNVISAAKSLDDLTKALTDVGYFTQVQSLKCTLPDRQQCMYTPLDVVFALNIVNDNTDVLSYLGELMKQFGHTYMSHFAYAAFGITTPQVLIDLTVHSDNDFNTAFWEYTRYEKNLSLTTTAAPTTPPKNQLDEDVFSNLVMTSSDIQTMLQYVKDNLIGCGHYDDDHDRMTAPNLIAVVSDNFPAAGSNVWDAFATEINSLWPCDGPDCIGKPAFLFVSLNGAKPSDEQMRTDWTATTLTPDSFNMTLTSSVQQFNTIVNSICNLPLPTCASYPDAVTCKNQ